MFDLIIIGASAAGVAASVYAKRRNLNFKLLSLDVGGEVATSGEIENYLGFPKTDGIALAGAFKEQLTYNGIVNEEIFVEKIVKKNSAFLVIGKKNGEEEVTLDVKTILIATGVHPRTLDIPGEKEFKNRGLSYCTVCDGPLFKDKIVAVIGGGNSALESVLMLATIAKQVYSININHEFKGEDILIEKVKKLANAILIGNAKTKKIFGEQFVKGLEYEANDTKEAKRIEAQGIFVHIGMLPNAGFIDLVEKNMFGEIKVDKLCQTDIPGIFAAGDVTDVPYKQINIAAGQGTLAALGVVDYLNKLKV